jgi:hypothetical protein
MQSSPLTDAAFIRCGVCFISEHLDFICSVPPACVCAGLCLPASTMRCSIACFGIRARLASATAGRYI